MTASLSEYFSHFEAIRQFILYFAGIAHERKSVRERLSIAKNLDNADDDANNPLTPSCLQNSRL